MNRKLGAAVILGGFTAWTAASAETKGTHMETATLVTPQSDLAALKRIVPIPGEPDALWARLPMGHIDPSARVPGPTDLMVFASLDYGTTEAVRNATTDAQGTAETLDVAADPARYTWLPKAVLRHVRGGKLHVLRFGPLEMFGGADVLALEEAPHILLLRKVLP